MRKVRASLTRLAFAVLLGASHLFGAGGAGEPIVVVADSRRFTGWEAWFANLYNEDLFYFTVVTVITIPVMGVILGTAADFLMGRIGLNLKSRSVAEH